MIQVLSGSWALLLGIMLLMVGNGIQGSLLGVMVGEHGFTTLQISIVMSGYFLGLLAGSRVAPEMIRRVGHVRVFAALASFISAVLILFPVLPSPITWTLGRIIIGFCFAGVYVTAESWLNNSADNENRGKALSLYLMVQMAGIVMAQGLLNFGDSSGYFLFILSSVLVSLSFGPILLSISPTPAFDTTKAMSLRDLFNRSPLGLVGAFFLGGVFAAQFGMSAVYAIRVGLSLGQLSIFISTIYIGAVVMQYPIGWVSDRMDRRVLIGITAAVGAAGGVIAIVFDTNFYAILLSGFFIGATSNPLYALLIAHTNDSLEHEEMAAASGGLVFANGLGAIAGPLITGWAMNTLGNRGFFVYMVVLMSTIAGYAVWRAFQRPAANVDSSVSYVPVGANATAVAVEVAQEVFIEAALEEESNTSPSD